MQEKAGELTVRRMCESAEVSRAGFYRFSPREKGKADIELRDAMQRIALEFPSYGWRRMTAELKRRGSDLWPNSSQSVKH
jgi:putative transposase